MVKFSAVDDCENIGFQRTLVKYGMDLTEEGGCRLCNNQANEDPEEHSIHHIGESKYMEAKKKGKEKLEREEKRNKGK